mgnify:CR=1 FL=1
MNNENKEMSVRLLNALSEDYKTNAELQNDRELTLKLVLRRPELYEYASDKLKADEEIAETCFKGDGRLIRFAPESIRSNPKIALVAATDYPLCISFLTGEAAESREIAELVAKNGGSAIEALPEKFFSDKEIAKIAVTKNAKNVRFFSENVRADEEVCLAALAQDRTVCAYFADDAFKSDKVFERSVRADRGVIGANTLSNDMPLGLFEKIAEKNLTIRLGSQKIDLLTIDYDKLYAVLSVCEGNVIRKKELLARVVEKDDRKCAELLCEKFSVPPQTIKDALPYAVQHRKMRVLPYLMSYMHSKNVGEREEREKIVRGLKRNSPKAVQTLFDNISEYKTDREVILLCAKVNGAVLKLIEDSPLFNDSEIVSECVKSYVVKNADKPFVLWFKTMPFSYDDLKVLCRKDHRNYFALDEKYRKDSVLCAEAVRSGIGVYDMMAEDMKQIPIVKEAKR